MSSLQLTTRMQEALIYPSTYEGFGLPPLEAMGLGCPVIVSSAPPLPEVVENAGLYFNPNCSDELFWVYAKYAFSN